MRFACLLLAATACHPPGLTLEVLIEDDNLKKVELFVGDRCSGDCPYGTIPPSLPAMPVDRAYVVPDQVPWSIDSGDFDDRTASFRLEASEDTTLGIVVVVGYDASDQPRWSSTFRGITVPAYDTAHWQVRLTPTTPIEPTPAAAGSARIARWEQPSKRLPSCLLLEHWESSTTAYRELVVPDTDRDCDEVDASNECAPWVPNAMQASPEVSRTSCVLTATLGNVQAPVCVLGGPECSESSTQPSPQCVPVAPPHCVSSGLCGCSAAADLMGCVTEKIGAAVATGAVPYFKCSIQLESNGEACSSSLMQADAGAYLSSTGSTKCAGITFTEPKLPLSSFSSALVVDAESRLKIEHFDQPCKIDLAFSGVSSPQRRLALARIGLDNGNAIVIPAVIDLHANGCAAESQCSFYRPPTTSSYDGIWQCIEQRAFTPACAADTDKACAGPQCNGVCCGEGERCTPNGCACGSGPACADGDLCATAGPLNPDQCGSICCGQSGPCPL